MTPPGGMNSTLASVLAALALCALLALSLTAVPAASAARPLATGVTLPDAGLVEQPGYDRIRGAGAKYTRISIFWSQVAPARKPNQWNPADPADRFRAPCCARRRTQP